MKLFTDINYLLEKQDKKSFAIITILLFIAGFLEAASIALVLPLISLLIDKDKIINLPIVKDLVPNISEYSHESLIIIIECCLNKFYFKIINIKKNIVCHINSIYYFDSFLFNF